MRKGYTLVEMMITVGIFGLAFIAIGAIFIGYSTAQSRATTAQRLLNEGAYLFETVVREVRMHAIDYDNCVLAGSPEDSICLRSVGDGSAIRFRVLDDSGEKAVEVCREAGPNPCLESDDWANLVADYLRVTAFAFDTHPIVNPTIATDDDQMHPLTNIRMSIEAGSGNAKQTYSFQTSVSSRGYSF